MIYIIYNLYDEETAVLDNSIKTNKYDVILMANIITFIHKSYKQN